MPENDLKLQAAAIAVSSALATGGVKAQAVAGAVRVALAIGPQGAESMKAIAAAAAVGLALQAPHSLVIEKLPASMTTPWQTIMRARQIAMNSQVYKRR